MLPSQRIILNTTAQYSRTAINVLLSLYSTRLILLALGQTDYGIYSIVAGVVSMLSFVTNALVSTTQRYLSYEHGRDDKQRLYAIFGNSMLLHLFIGGVLTFVLVALEPWVMQHLLHIEADRLLAAKVVYFAMAAMLLLSFITAPYRALFIARENIVYISVIDVLDGVLKLLIAIWLAYISFDKLIVYAVLMVGISVFNIVAFAAYALAKYDECHWVRFRELDKTLLQSLSGFAVWTIYSTACILVRTQGIAVLLNRVFGSVINAAYGIALQVAGATQFLAQSIMNAMNPQIVKAESSDTRGKMLFLSEMASKYAFLLLSMAAIPLIAEMPDILALWLKEVPEGTVMFCRFILAAAIIDQLTIGLGTANQAIGQIRNYSLIVNTTKMLTLPVAWLCLHLGLPMVSVMWCYLIFEFICAMIRLPFLKYTAGLQIMVYLKRVFLPVILPTCTLVVVCLLCVNHIHLSYRFVVTILCAVAADAVVILLTSLTSTERQIIKDLVSKLRRK